MKTKNSLYALIGSLIVLVSGACIASTEKYNRQIYVNSDRTDQEIDAYLRSLSNTKDSDDRAVRERKLIVGMSRGSVNFLCANKLVKDRPELWRVKTNGLPDKYMFDSRQAFVYFEDHSDSIAAIVVRGSRMIFP